MNGVKFLRNKNNNARKSFSQLQTMSTRKRFNRCRRRLSRKRRGGGTKINLSGISYEIFFVNPISNVVGYFSESLQFETPKFKVKYQPALIPAPGSGLNRLGRVPGRQIVPAPGPGLNRLSRPPGRQIVPSPAVIKPIKIGDNYAYKFFYLESSSQKKWYVQNFGGGKNVPPFFSKAFSSIFLEFVTGFVMWGLKKHISKTFLIKTIFGHF